MEFYIHPLIGRIARSASETRCAYAAVTDSRNLPFIKIEFNEKEMDAVEEYARQCGESIPSLVRKLVIRDATLADGYGADDSSYDFKIMLPSENSASADREQIQNTYNRVRRIMGWKEIQL